MEQASGPDHPYPPRRGSGERRRRRDDPDGSGLVRERLLVIQLAEQLGNVAQACRLSHTDRATFYDWRRRYQAHGPDGLKDRQPASCLDPARIGDTLKERICALALERAANTPVRISAILALSGLHVNSAAIETVLGANGLATAGERWLALEEKARAGETLTPEQAAFVAGCNPAFRERARAEPSPAAPGALLVQDALFAGTLESGVRVYAHLVIDTASAFAFASLHPSRHADGAVYVLHREVLPFYRAHGRAVRVITTAGGAAFRRGTGQAYRIYLGLNEIEQRAPSPQTGQRHGFIERWSRKLRDGWMLPHGRNLACFESAELAFAVWLRGANMVDTWDGYPNYGRSPDAAMNEALGP